MIIEYKDWKFETNIPMVLMIEIQKAIEANHHSKALELQLKALDWGKRDGPDINTLGYEDFLEVSQLILGKSQDFLGNK